MRQEVRKWRGCRENGRAAPDKIENDFDVIDGKESDKSNDKHTSKIVAKKAMSTTRTNNSGKEDNVDDKNKAMSTTRTNNSGKEDNVDDKNKLAIR